MKTASISFNPFMQGIKPLRSAFKGFPFIKPLKEDSFELSSNVQKVKIKDISGSDKEAVITKSAEEGHSGDDSEKFVISADGKNLGYAVVKNSRNKKELNLFHLYTEEHASRHYKGAGTELLKCAVKESINRGYNGKTRLYASHAEYSPLVFYYKNNFIVEKSASGYIYELNHNLNAAIHYAALNNLPIYDVLPYSCSQTFMYLDEKGAEAFLDGKRLYENRTAEKLSSKEINGVSCTASLIQSPYENEYYLLVTEDEPEKKKAMFAVTLEEKEADEGGKYFEIKDLYNYEQGGKKHCAFALETLGRLSEEKGYKKEALSPKMGIDASLWIE